MKKITNSEQETKEFAKTFFQKNQKNVLLLFGDLGSGKTVFSKGAADFYNLKSTITSPTYVIIKEYEIKKSNFSKLVHIDLYRIDRIDQDLENQIKEYIEDKSNLLIIEWPENIMSIIPKNVIQKIIFKHISKNKREITIL